MSQNIPVPRYTYDDYARWKEDWELIDGYPYQLFPSAKWQHNNAQGNLFFRQKPESIIRTAIVLHLQSLIGRLTLQMLSVRI